VIPIFTPVYMDAVLVPGLWRTLVNQYKQKRRWAWGIEHFPYLVNQCLKNKEISLWERLVLIFRLLEGHISWAAASLLIALAGWIPLVLNPHFRSTVLAFNLPIMARNLLGLTWIGIIISTAISYLLLPPRPAKYSYWKTISMLIQWILVPISAIFFGSIPAIDAQTRLMLGKYLGFWVTEKTVVEKELPKSLTTAQIGRK
jgi:hypothetical protein